MRTNEAREIAAEDHSLSRFVGSKRAMGDDSEQLADLVYTDKRKQHSKRANIVTALNAQTSCAEKIRNICIDLGCHCRSSKSCNCGDCNE